MNLQVKVAHVLVKKRVNSNMTVIFYRLYSSACVTKVFKTTISKNIYNVFHSRVFVEFFLWSFGNDGICKAPSFSLLITSRNFMCEKV